MLKRSAVYVPKYATICLPIISRRLFFGLSPYVNFDSKWASLIEKINMSTFLVMPLLVREQFFFEL